MARTPRETWGQVWKTWTFICGRCGYWDVYSGHQAEHPTKKLRQSNAELWARNEGWSKTKDGWVCPACRTRPKE